MAFDERGNIISTSTFDIETRKQTDKKFNVSYGDDSKRKSTFQVDKANNNLGTVNYKYDDKGNVIAVEKSGKAGSGKEAFSYDDKGRKISQKTLNASGDVLSETSFSYNDAGKLVKENFNGGSYVYEYENGRVTSKTEYDVEGKMKGAIAHSYDKAGQISITKFKNAEGDVESYKQFFYDENGNVKKVVVLEDDVLVEQTQYRIHYYK